MDERLARLWRANFAFQALEVPAGRHQVVLTYEDAWFRWGVLISLVSLGTCLAGWIIGQRRLDAAPS